MRNGYLNKTELRKAAKAYLILNELQAMLPSFETCTDTEQTTLNNLVNARNHIGTLLQWQSFNGVWKEIKQHQFSKKISP
jgi:hypothetical protein